MRKPFLSLFLLPLFFLSVPAAEFEIKDLSGGMWSNPSANRIPDNAAPLIQNFFTDVEPIATERNGYEKRDSTVLGDTQAVTGLWEFVDISGQQWIISFSSRTFYQNLPGDTPTAFGLSATVDTIPQAAVNLGRIWYVNGTDDLWWFDGTSTGSVTSAPLGRLIVPWRTRIVISNVPGSQSTVHFSGDGDGESWTLGGNPTNPFTLEVGGANDGFNVTCMWESYLDNLIVARKKDLHSISGFDKANVVLRTISSEIGCIQNGSMREFDGSLIFLSNRGLEEMRGITIKHISEPIRNLTDLFIENTSQERKDIHTSQADWEAGTSDPLLNLKSDFIIGSLSTFTTNFILTTSTDFGNGSLETSQIYADTITVANQLQTTFPDFFTSYRDGSSGTKDVYDDIVAPIISGTVVNLIDANNNELNIHASAAGANFNITLNTVETTHDITVSNGATFYFEITGIDERPNSNSIVYPVASTDPQNDLVFVLRDVVANSYFNAVANDAYWYLAFLSTSSSRTDDVLLEEHKNSVDGTTNIGTWCTLPCQVKFWLDGSNYNITLDGVSVDSGAHAWTGTNVFPHFALANCCTASSEQGAEVDDFVINPQTFTYTSSSFDTTVSTPIFGNLDATVSTPTITFGTRTSDDDISFDAEVIVATGSAPTSTQRRYVKQVIHFEDDRTSFPGTLTHTLQDTDIPVGSSGTFTSQVVSIGTVINNWGPVSILDTQVGGSITYEFNASSNSAIADFNSSSWTSIASGGVPTNSTQPFAAFRAFLTIDSATNSVRINEFTITWSEGSGIQPLVSWEHSRRYWLAFTTNTASQATNDRVLVYQRNRTFSLLKGINSVSFATWQDQLYFGDAEASGFVYKFDTGNADDGSDIDSTIKFKSYDLGGFNQDKDYRNLYVNYLGGTNFLGSLSLSYEVDRDGNSFSLGSANMNEVNGQVSAKFPFPLSNPVQGRELQYTLTKSGTGDRLKLYDLKTQFTVLEAR